ncbi:MAG: AhpC/TSA family protein [Ignavibacteria bacterium]|nr:AhpC/TSA family protein [Ignavibacteria bacterium]
MRFILLLLIITITDSYSQKLIVEIKNSNINTAALYSLSGEKNELADTLRFDNSGKCRYTFPNKLAGFYRLKIENNKQLDFIYDDEDIEITADANNLAGSLEVRKSESNRLYYAFLKLNKAYKEKSELLNLIIARFPKDDEYYQITGRRLNEIQKEYLEFVNVTSQQNPKSFIARYIKSAQLPVIDQSIPVNAQLNYLKAISLNNVDFDDTDLKNSDVFANKSIEYLIYFRNPQLTKDQLEKEFTAAVDTILSKAKVNPLVYQHLTEYLVDGFRKFGFDKIIDYILDNYVIKDDVCLDSELELSIDRRIKQARLFKIGNEIPLFSLPDVSGNQVKLNTIKADKILLIFYSSKCPHCGELLPEIKKYYEKQKSTTKVIAVSMDENKEDWLNFIKINNLTDWVNLCDLNGWNSPVVEYYYIYATPTMFLLDKDLKIIGKDYK